MAVLPHEIIVAIIENVIPPRPAVSYPASHPITRTLFSLSLVSRWTRRVALRLLLQYCLYIDSPRRLSCLLETLVEVPAVLETANTRKEIRQKNTCSQIEFAVGLYLSPFPDDSIDHLSIAKEVRMLLRTLSSSLTRLVIDIPLRSLYPDEDVNHVRPILREAFVGLTAIEDFCSARDELYLATEMSRPSDQSDVWSLWPNLRRLALYNPVAEESLLTSLQRCGYLTHLVLTRADYTVEDARNVGILSLPCLKRILLIDGDDRRPTPEEKTWWPSFLGRLLVARTNSAVRPDIEFIIGPAENNLPIIEQSQEWVRDHAIDDTLWALSGTHLIRDECA